MRRAAASLRLVTFDSVGAHSHVSGQAASAAGSSSGGGSLLASLRTAAFKAGLASTQPGLTAAQRAEPGLTAAAQRAAFTAAASAAGIPPASLAAAALLAAGRRGLQSAARRTHRSTRLPPCAHAPQCARLSTRAGLAAEVAQAATAAVPASWAAHGCRMRTRMVDARRQLACRMEWVLGRGFHAREAFFNAIYMQASGVGRQA